MWVIVTGAQFVQIQQWLVDTLFKLKCAFKSLNPTAPLIPFWLLQSKELKKKKKKTGQKINETIKWEVKRLLAVDLK